MNELRSSAFIPSSGHSSSPASPQDKQYTHTRPPQPSPVLNVSNLVGGGRQCGMARAAARARQCLPSHAACLSGLGRGAEARTK